LNGLVRRRRKKDDGKTDGLNDGWIDERNRKLLQVVGKRQHVAANVDGRVAMHARPERSVGRVLAGHRVVTDELDGERVLVDEQLRRNVEIGFLIVPIGAAELSGIRLDGGEQGSIQNQFEVAELRDQRR
jgi:hypothetical protein